MGLIVDAEFKRLSRYLVSYVYKVERNGLDRLFDGSVSVDCIPSCQRARWVCVFVNVASGFGFAY